MGRGGGGGGAFKKNKTLHSHNLVLSDRFLRIRGCPDSLPSSGQSAAAPVRPARLPLPRTAAEARWALLFHSEWRRKRCLHVVWGRSHFRFQRGKRVIRSEVEVCQHAEARQLMCPVRELGQAIVFRVLRFFLFFLSSPPLPHFELMMNEPRRRVYTSSWPCSPGDGVERHLADLKWVTLAHWSGLSWQPCHMTPQNNFKDSHLQFLVIIMNILFFCVCGCLMHGRNQDFSNMTIV